MRPSLIFERFLLNVKLILGGFLALVVFFSCRSVGFPERDISSLGAMRQGPGTFRELFAWRVRLSVFWEESRSWLKRNNTF